MILSGLDFGLIIIISYFVGFGSGISVICKYKDTIMIRSRSRDNLSSISQNGLSHSVVGATPVVPSVSPPKVTKITLE